MSFDDARRLRGTLTRANYSPGTPVSGKIKSGTESTMKWATMFAHRSPRQRNASVKSAAASDTNSKCAAPHDGKCNATNTTKGISAAIAVEPVAAFNREIG
jgi:hypothetical protein